MNSVQREYLKIQQRLAEEAAEWERKKYGGVKMDINDYQRKALSTVVYPDSAKVTYPAMGLANEVGEVLGKLKKRVRGDYDDATNPEWRTKVGDEMGDVLWYLAALATDLDLNLSTIAARNLDKLEDRAERGVVKGDGDTR